MSISSAQSEKIKKTLEIFVSDNEPFLLNFDVPINIRAVAAELKFLPMAFDWSGCFGVQTDGEILVLDFNQNKPYKLEIKSDPRIRRMVLFQGSKKYPELSNLVPIRPSDAVDCNSCNGAGIDPMNQKCGFDEQRIVCWCGGLGWLTKDEKQLS